MSLNEDTLWEEPHYNNCVKNDDAEDDNDESIPMEAMPNITLPQVSLPPSLEPLVVKVIRIEDPGSFYLQMNKHQEFFKRFSQNLNDYYSTTKSSPFNCRDLPPFSVWAADAGDKWRRAVVLGKESQVPGSPPAFKMKFIDLGYTKVVDLHHIRYLEEEYTLDPPFALRCALAQVFPTNKWMAKPWSKEAISCFYDLSYTLDGLNAIIISDRRESHYEVILETIDCLVINEELVKRGFAISSVINKFPQDPDCEDVLPLDSALPSRSFYANKVVEDFKSDWDPMEEEYTKSSDRPYVNNESAELVLNGFENDDDKTICRFFKYQGKCRRGDACPWRHIVPRKDGLPSGSISVFQFLEEEFFLPKVGSWMTALISTIYSPQEFYIQVLNVSADRESKGHIIIKNPFLSLHKDLMKEFKLTSGYLNAPLPAIGELMITHSTTLPYEGFYRVRVLQVKETDDVVLVQVFFIDVGTTEWVKEKQLRPFSSRFLNPPALAIRCYLSDLSPATSTGWGSDAKDFFSKHIMDNIQTIIVTEVDEMMEDRIGVIVANTNEKKTVNEALLEAGLAVLGNVTSAALLASQ